MGSPIYIVFFCFFLFINLSYAKSSLKTDPNANRSWFSPSLALNNAPLCKDILKEAEQVFLTDVFFYFYFLGQNYREDIEIAGMRPVYIHKEHHFKKENVAKTIVSTGKTYVGQISTLKLNGHKYYIREYTKTGCGSYCDQHQVLISKQAELSAEQLKRLLKTSPPLTGRFQLYIDKHKSYWLFQLDESNNLDIYKLLPTAHWKKSCHLLLNPPPIKEIDDPDIQEALGHLQLLKKSVGGLTRGEGFCGSSGTLRRWNPLFEQNLKQILFRPWPLVERINPNYINDDLYQYDLIGLENWSLMGISEYLSFKNYLLQFEKTVFHISQFYQKKFNWDKQKSETIARNAITYAVSGTIRFYKYMPTNNKEKALRQAILEKQPLSKIKSIDYKLKETVFGNEESLLSTAVLYPEALQYLINQGLNPNHENAFGKTPLMYAAQYNQVESAKILLKAGAYPNISTTKPFDTCTYSLSTFDMTALHYAVRYASPEFIQLLLKYRADVSLKANNHRIHPAQQETPLVWLKRYTQNGFDEKNPFMPNKKIHMVEKWLTHETSPLKDAENNRLNTKQSMGRNKK